MNYLTLAQARPTIARVIGRSENHSSVADYINEAVQRLMVRGNWVGTVVRYRVCVNEAKLTWPRHIHTILKCNICRSPVPVANGWYEFAAGGPGTLHDDDSIGLVLQDMGTASTFDDIGGTNRTLRVLGTEEEDGAEICIQGYDNSNQWIRTLHNGSLVDGEYFTITTTGTVSAHVWSNVTRVIKPVTEGNVLLYERETSTLVEKPLGIYEPDETLPSYRRSRIPALDTVGDCGTGHCEDDHTAVNVKAKLRFIPVTQDTDWILIGNLPALKDMVMSILKAEKDLPEEAEIYETRAIRELSKELVDYEGESSFPRYDVQDPRTFGAGSITGVI
jgi:hypothetical protein